ncbi:MAG: type II toxin-antitoxin system Phd/YefM family antitoxin [Sphingomonadaceae bacterium]
MPVVNVHEAKTHFSKLLARVAAGERITIAKAGKPVAELGPPSDAAAAPPPPRIGMLDGQWDVPEDFDPIGADEIRADFEDGPLFPPR